MNENRTTVLIVDDEPSIRLSLRTILSGLGFAVVEAARGEEGVALVQTARFDVVLLDINIPGLGGIEVCRRIRKIGPFPAIVILTMQGREDYGVEALVPGRTTTSRNPSSPANSLHACVWLSDVFDLREKRV
jgi:two-component system KDP operon response regulator KdpE